MSGVFVLAITVLLTLFILAVNAALKAQRRVAQLEATPKPVLSFGPCRTEEMLVFAVGDSSVTQQFAFGSVLNSQSTPGRGVVAQRAIPRLTYRSATGQVIAGPVDGRWREAPSPATGSPHQLHTGTAAIDLDPNRTTHEFDIATADVSQLVGIDAAQDPYELHTREVVVDVEIDGNNFEPLAASFHVRLLPDGKLTVAAAAA